MSSAAERTLPPDQAERERALDARRSILVQAPAGSGKTDLLTRRFLRLLSEVDEPGQIVAITFTKAAAAEMRQRILSKLETAADGTETDDDPLMRELAQRALERSRAAEWNLIELPAQLRISTIDSFCRELALQQPLLSGLGGGLEIAESPKDLYRRAARRALEALDSGDTELREAIAALLLWRDNSWHEMEEQLMEMLDKRDKWMHEFVVSPQADWDALRAELEAPFRNAVRDALVRLDALLNEVPHAHLEILELTRFACAQTDGKLYLALAEMAEFPAPDEVEDAYEAFSCVAQMLLTKQGALRSKVDKSIGFPAASRTENARLVNLIADLRKVPRLEEALAAVSELPTLRYTEDEWRIVRACFALLRRAAAELQVVFAEAARVDFIEVTQIAENVLRGENEIPGEAALAAADGIRHLLVDEFQDTSRRQHRLLARLIGAWDQRVGRTCFVVGDPMQSIYFFRDADAELFPRVAKIGLDIPHELPLEFDLVRLFANFRTAHELVRTLNEFFSRVFLRNDGSGVTFAEAEPARDERGYPDAAVNLHLEFISAAKHGSTRHEKERIEAEREAARQKQTAEIVALVQAHLKCVDQTRKENAERRDGKKEKYRIAVLGRTRRTLASVAEALREAKIPFRAIDLEELKERPEVLDALALARALANPQDRVAWLGVLRAPWCGLALSDLHKLASGDDEEWLRRSVPELMVERLELLSTEGRAAVERVLGAIEEARRSRAARPAASLGTWLEQVWLQLGGAACVDATERANLDLLWSCLDELPQGELDVSGPALNAALEDLKALPDRGVDGDYGVQLMTIHKSKGLEFEVVIVPDLQARAAHTPFKLLSWLERGLDRGVVEQDGSDSPTEFLIAPMPTKGAEGGAAKKWVDRVYRERESQEMRRLLYVAATRAREELHLFARPEYSAERDGSRTLMTPKNSLLATAWPAIEADVRERFNAWNQPREVEVEAIAAEAEPLAAAPSTERVAIVRRLPVDFANPHGVTFGDGRDAAVVGMGQLYERHEGGLESRALGVGVHTLMQQMVRLREKLDWEGDACALMPWGPRIAAQIRAAGIGPQQAERMAAQAIEIALKASHDATGRWILSPHADAESEVQWAGVVSGSLRTVRLDRIFRAGAQPQISGEDVWWIIDYKTAHEEGLHPEDALPKLREIFRPQIEAYAQMLINLHGADAKIHGGLYYPRMLQFDWWEIG